MRSDGQAFRPDITGLRALAVLAVVFFHFEIAGFGGGFAGVDIFFVISGFLMTGIVVSGLVRENFSLVSFYRGRVRRIVPALVVLCITLLCVGWRTLPPNDYRNLGKHVAASMAFLSNFKYWSESGYFSANSHDKWLLHTWSLSVEWQYYLLLPLLLMSAWKLRPRRRTIGIVLSILGSASYLLSGITSANDGGTSFYLLPGRAWEMIAGGLVFLWGGALPLSNRIRYVLEAAGLALAVVSIGFLNSITIWPGWLAALPVASTAMVLVANRSPSLLTGNFLAQWIGKRSYSIYLWHWPIVVALHYAGQLGKPFAIVCGLMGTTLLGHFSYCWIEVATSKSPVRRGYFGTWTTLGGAGLVLCASLGIFLANGVPGRLSKEVDAISAGALDRNPRSLECVPGYWNKPVQCAYGGNGPAIAIVLGDSHAGSIVGAVAQATLDTGHGSQSLIQMTFSACPTTVGVKSRFNSTDACGSFVTWALQELSKLPAQAPVIILNRHASNVRGGNEDHQHAPQPQVYFTHEYTREDPTFTAEYAQHITETACEIAKTRPVYLVRPTPEMGVNIPNTARAMVWGIRQEATVPLADYHARNDFAWAAQDEAHKRCGVKILDPTPFLCWDGVCHSVFSGRAIYSDDNHLSQFGSRLLLPMFRTVFTANPP